MIVATSGRVRVVVEIERSAATVSGRARIAGSAAVEFYGWLELIDQLEGALSQAITETPTSSALADPKAEASTRAREAR